MSLWSSLTDALSKPLSYVYGEGSAVSTGKQIDAQLATINQSYAPGGTTYTKIQATQGTAAADKAYQTELGNLRTGSTDNIIATGDANAAANNASKTDFGTVIKDLFILAAIGGAIWAFIKFGGAGMLKSLAKKSKWMPWVLAGAAALAVWIIYSRVKKTASDTGAAAGNLGSDLKFIL